MEAAREQVAKAMNAVNNDRTLVEPMADENMTQLPTPPSEGENTPDTQRRQSQISPLPEFTSPGNVTVAAWDTLSTKLPSPAPSLPPLEVDEEPPSFEDAQNDTVIQSSDLQTMLLQYPHPSSSRGSPSSMQAEFDKEDIDASFTSTADKSDELYDVPNVSTSEDDDLSDM